MITVSEIYGPVLQGEGPVLGRPTVFVRVGGCSYRCAWCDSLHAVLPERRPEWRSMEVAEVMDRVVELAGGPMLVTLTGGDPSTQPCAPLVRMGHALGYTFGVETQGAIASAWLSEADVVVFSPKPPSSGMSTDWRRFEWALGAAGVPEGAHEAGGPPMWSRVSIKVPILDGADLDWFEERVAGRYAFLPLYLSVVNDRPAGDADVGALLARWRWLSEEVVRRRLNVVVTPQAHVLLYGNERGR